MKEKRKVGRPKLADSALKKQAVLYIVASLVIIAVMVSISIPILFNGMKLYKLKGFATTNVYCKMGIDDITKNKTEYTIKYTINCNRENENIKIQYKANGDKKWKELSLNNVTKVTNELKTNSDKKYLYLRAKYYDNRYTEIKKIDFKTKKVTIISDKDVIYFLNVVGQATVIRSEGKTFLIDAGLSRDYNEIAEFLKNRGISQLDGVIFTHLHQDHTGINGNVDNIINTFKPSTIYVKKPLCEDESSSNVTGVYNYISSFAKENKLNVINIAGREGGYNDGDKITIGNYTLTFYNTKNVFTKDGLCKNPKNHSENTNSLMILIRKDDKKILIAGDIDNSNNDRNLIDNYKKRMLNTEYPASDDIEYTPLLNYYSNLIGKVNVYVAAHHGYYNGGMGVENTCNNGGDCFNLYNIPLYNLKPRYIVITMPPNVFSKKQDNLSKPELLKTAMGNKSYKYMFVIANSRKTLKLTNNSKIVKFTRVSNN